MNDLYFLFKLVTLLNPGLFIIASKIRLIEHYEIHRKRWMPKKCEFCLFFWMTTLEVTTYLIMQYHFGWLLIPIVFIFAVCSATLSRIFV